MVVTLLGIKLKWFKHRLTFDGIPSPEVATSSAQRNSYLASSAEPQILRATFRTGDDFDRFIDITPPTVLPRK